MSDKLTPKQEAFVLAYLETGNASEAYRRAYAAKNMSDAAIRVEACRLTDNPNVALAIQAGRDQATKRNEITVDTLVDELNEARLIALQSPRGASAAVSATLGKAKLLGLIIDRSEVGKPGEFDEMNAGQLRDFIAAEAETLGVSNTAPKASGRNGKARSLPN
jgi:phage terminase small subunit